jgi:DNA-directed RNA polymerase specialized sigma24 family protein
VQAEGADRAKLAACELFAQRVASRIVSDPAKRYEYVLIGYATAWELYREDPSRPPEVFLAENAPRIIGAMKDALRKEARANALDAALARGVQPIAAQLELGDLFDSPQSRTQTRRQVIAAVVTSALLGAAPHFDAHTPETALLTAEETHRLRAALQREIDALDPDDALLLRQVFFEGLTLEAAGEPRGITKSAVSKRLRNSLDLLAKRLRSARDGGRIRAASE